MGLIDRFVKEHQRSAPRPTQHPDLQGAALRALNQQAAELSGRSAEPQLSPELRARFAGKRFPAWREVLLQCGKALALHPEISQRTEVTAQSCEQTVKLDIANGQLLKTTGDAHDAAEDGVRLVAAEANGLGRRALGAARDRIQDRAAPAPERVALETAFAEAFRSFAEAREREDRSAARLARIQGAAAAEIKDAADRADAARTRAELLPSNKE